MPSEYKIIKREKCPDCNGKGFNVVDADKGIMADCPRAHKEADFHCNGYIETQVDADEWLRAQMARMQIFVPAKDSEVIKGMHQNRSISLEDDVMPAMRIRFRGQTEG